MANEGMDLLLAAGGIDAVKDFINRICQPEPFLILSVIGLAVFLKGYRFFTKPSVALAMLGLFIIAIHHDVDAANRLGTVTTDGTSVSVQTDRAGNVIHDGNYVQRYDAWNRLLEVYEPGTAVLDDYGVVTDGELGALIATYSYDGVGRLIRIERTKEGEPVTIDLYYDGVRRIQERITTDEPEGGQQMMAGGGELEPTTTVVGLTPGPEDFGTPAAGGEVVLAEGTPPPPNPPGGDVQPEGNDAAIRLDASSTATSEPLMPSEGPEPLGGGAMGMSGQTIIAEREYIWGPDYVDECVVQLDENNTPYYVIQDANYNVVALLDATGLPVVQYTYEPYGALQLAESFAQHPVNRLGHQGLFFERFDAGPFDPALVPAARGLCYARNRWYNPVLSRWTSRDPNETGLPIERDARAMGNPRRVVPEVVDLEGHYADGLNLYTYALGNPTIWGDALGLDATDLLVVRNWDAIWESIVGNGSAYLGVQGGATFGAFWGENVTLLPEGALRAAALSEGFSNFADYYAEQMIWLPVEGAFAGLSAFAKISAVAQSTEQVRRGSRFARMERVRELGQAGEAAAGIAKNTKRITSLTGTAAYRVPDILTETIIGDVKNVAKLSLTGQMRDFLMYARSTGRQFVLIVRRNTQLSGPLQTLVDEGAIVLQRTLP